MIKKGVNSEKDKLIEEILILQKNINKF